MEGTKDYICKAMVTVVDHLGTVSANIESLLDSGARLSDSEFRLHCLNQVTVEIRYFVLKNLVYLFCEDKISWQHLIKILQKIQFMAIITRRIVQ